MNRATINHMANYLKDLEEEFVEWDYRGMTTQEHLNKLYKIIEQLMKATFETKNQEIKVLLATLEYKCFIDI